MSNNDDNNDDNEIIYKKGIVYSITGLETGSMYIGSTIRRLSKRISEHKTNRSCVSVDILDNEQYCVDILETYYNITRKTLFLNEGNYQLKFKDMIINQLVAGRSYEEWYKCNKDRLILEHKEYRKNNKEKINKYHENYRELNRDLIKSKSREIIKCECGINITYGNITKHKKRKIHQKYLDDLSKIKFNI